MANGDDKTSTSSAVWDRLDQHGRSISDLVAAQAATQANLDALARTMQSGFEQIKTSINALADDQRLQRERDSKPVNWYAIVSAVILVGGALLAFNALQTDPVRIRAMELSGQMQQIVERDLQYANEHGRVRAEIDMIERRLNVIEGWQHDAMREFGRLDEISNRVADIDTYGSRRWNEGPPK